jgi:predicted 3-demethylubiquinone-9 3-methyltransferase (glyoxalase superfamily)
MQKIVTNLWFDGRVEEALEFYTSISAISKVNNVSYYGDEHPDKKGEVLVADFELEGVYHHA